MLKLFALMEPEGRLGRRLTMIKLAIICLVIALVSAILGFGGISGAFVDIALFLFVAALVLAAIFLFLGIRAGKKLSDKL